MRCENIIIKNEKKIIFKKKIITHYTTVENCTNYILLAFFILIYEGGKSSPSLNSIVKDSQFSFI